ncbi:MAG: hypothetical protein EOQ40_30330 [Mesorhizobium sp.]|uniref:hypothetical protein n=2 Tax=Mesorhizobium sp. TaxID=1871066 RepID=UPI000FE553E8|nr:hypothetical protein [Mesorhizobium sp.]RWB14335.1 MAG: hypothetical protein EOQ40_30330 [Mesorhizobium sp.]
MTMKFPFVENTPGKKLEAGTGLSVDCLTCKRKAHLDVAELVKRLGPDHRCLHRDLIEIIYCHECRNAGRDDRNQQFTDHAVTPTSGGDPMRDDELTERPSRGWTPWKEGNGEVDIDRVWWAARCLHFPKLNVSVWFDGSDMVGLAH